ncbi:MAG: hypothetical protein II864_07360 [Prevotella sp.]|nr:hypothetical protein [Prevotella sp.]
MMKRKVYIVPTAIVVDCQLQLLTQISVAQGNSTEKGVTRQRGILSRESDDYWDDFDDDNY